MARPTTSAEFLDLLGESRLIDDVILKHLRPQVLDPSSKSSQKPEYAARALFENNVITSYQARQLMAGRYRGFYIAKYKFMELLGVGGMGKVYLAEQITGPRLVVIKVVRTNFKSAIQKDETFARFRREAEAVARLKHPNIIKAIEYDHENGIPYFVMEYVEGIDLGQQVDRFGALPWAHAADNIVQAATALQHAHEAEMVHRDVKPQNLLVSTTGEVKLLDLGLVSPFEGTNDDSLTTAENQIGSVDYIAPEQAVDSRFVDPRADIYGLGATLYAILAGQVLYPDKTTAQKLLLNQTTMPTPIGKLVPDLPKELAAIITKMLAKSPDDRFATMAEVEAALRPFAKRRIPPYDLSAVKFPISNFKAFLGRSPHSASLSKVTIGQAQSASAAKDPRKADEASSTITTSSPEPEREYEDLFSGDHSRIAHLGLPPISHPKVTGSSSSRGRPSSKKKSSSGNDLQRAAAVMAGVGVFLMIPLIGIYLAVTDRIDDSETSSPAETMVVSAESTAVASEDADPVAEEPESPEETVVAKTPAPEEEPPVVTESESPPGETVTDLSPSEPVSADPPDAASPIPTEPEPEAQPDSEPGELVVAKADVEAVQPPAPAPPPSGPTWDSIQSFYQSLQEDPDMVWFASFTSKPKEGSTGDIKADFFANEAKNPTYTEMGLYLGNETSWLESEGRWKDKKGGIAFRGKPFVDVAAIPEQSLQNVPFEQGFTIALWVRIANTGLPQVLVSRGPMHWRLVQNKPGDIDWSVNRPGTKQHVRVQSVKTLTDENWHYLVAVYQPLEADASQVSLRLYIDGVEEGAAEGAGIRSDDPAAIALGLSHDRHIHKPLRGVIDDFMLVNRPLSPTEIQSFFNQSRLPEMEAVPLSEKTAASAVQD